MFDISPVQILIVLVIALLVFGPKRLPEMGKSVGRGIREFKGAIMDDEPNRAPAPPAAAGPPAPVEASAPATAPGPVAAAAAVPDDDDTVLEGVVVPGDTPPREPQA